MNKLLMIIVVGLLWTDCKKHDAPFNITLKDKPLIIIKAAIQGRWQMHYAYGGLSGHTRIDYTSRFIKFTDNHILFCDNAKSLADTLFYWKRVIDIFSQLRGSIFTMTFSDKRDYPYSWVVDGIYQDTLLLVDYGPDPMNYYLTRKK